MVNLSSGFSSLVSAAGGALFVYQAAADGGRRERICKFRGLPLWNNTNYVFILFGMLAFVSTG